MAKILYIEDDPAIALSVKDRLSKDGHTVELAETGKDGLQLCQSFEYDLVLVDWNLPDLAGTEICRQYRQIGGVSWLIFLTSMGKVEQKVEAFEAGADDYLVKPFDLQELSVRVMRALRRPESNFQAELRIGDLSLDIANRVVSAGGKSVHLMPKESALLEYLIRNQNKTLTGKKLLAAVWPSESESSETSVRTYILSLRKKLQQIGKEELLKTVPGSGYVIESN